MCEGRPAAAADGDHPEPPSDEDRQTAAAEEDGPTPAAAGGRSIPASAVDGEPALTDKQRRILAYLRERVEGSSYFKSRLIGRDLGLSAKEVGTNMPALVEGSYDVDVEKWGYSSSTTWKVTV